MYIKTVSIAVIIMLSVIYVPVSAQNSVLSTAKPAVELGAVQWFRDYEGCKSLSAESGKPVFILFQEVPGCATCTRFGSKVLSHPFIVELIENEFHPVVVYNNKGGNDSKLLKQFREPSWNNPVVRIVDASGADIIERHAGDYTLEGLALSMKAALLHTGKGVPLYFDLFLDELALNRRNSEEIVFSMYCFWSGEGALGKLDGVVSSEPGFANGKEVVKVTYNKEEVTAKELLSFAKGRKMELEKEVKNYRPDKDLQYYLKNSKYAFLPLSPIQRTKINSALYCKSDASVYLTPKQQELLNAKEKKKRPKIYDQELLESWQKVFGAH